MVATTLKLPPDLKKRIAPLAKRAGKTPHAWMVATLKREAERAELQEQLVEDALAAAAEADEGGPLFAAEDVHAYVLARASGQKARRPSPLRKTPRR